MATEAKLPLPEKGEKVSSDVLTSNSRTTLFAARGFGGIDDPTSIWDLMLRDTQQAFGFYRELEEKDTDAAGALEKLKLSVTGRSRRMVPADESQLALDIANDIETQMEEAGLDSALDFILDFPGYGVTISELIFDVSASQVKLLEIHDCPQELFRFNGYLQPPIGPLRLMQNQFDISGGDLVREDKFLVATYRPRARNRRGRPLYRSVFWDSWFKRNVKRFWLRIAEKGNGSVVAMYPQGATEEEKTRAVAMAEAVLNAVASAVPENAKFVEALLKGARTQSPDVFKALAEECKFSIVRRILGQTLTSFGNEGGTGSRSLGETHAEVEEERSKELAKQLEKLINAKIVHPLGVWNYGPNAPLPRWTIDKEPSTDLMERSEIDDRLQQMGLPIGKKYAHETYGIPEPANEKDVMQRAQGANAIGDGSVPQTPTTAVFTSDAAVKREAKDVDRLLEQGIRAGQDVMRARLAQIIGEVTQ
jgi:phage gp29-like protein